MPRGSDGKPQPKKPVPEVPEPVAPVKPSPGVPPSIITPLYPFNPAHPVGEATATNHDDETPPTLDNLFTQSEFMILSVKFQRLFLMREFLVNARRRPQLEQKISGINIRTILC